MVTNPCDINAVCITTGPGLYECRCNPGFSQQGSTCVENNPCDSQPCLLTAICENLGTIKYSCYCRPGYMGDGITNCEPNPLAGSATAGDISIEREMEEDAKQEALVARLELLERQLEAQYAIGQRKRLKELQRILKHTTELSQDMVDSTQ